MNGDDENDEFTDDETDLFRDAMSDVTPLRPHNKISRKPIPKKSIRNYSASDYSEAEQIDHRFSDTPVEDCPTTLSFSRSGLQHAVLKKLRTGKFPVEAELDMHGMIVSEAGVALDTFLNECIESGIRCALIIHGKGYSSPGNRPILKSYVNRWLRQVDDVLAFHSALPKHGGDGATYVLLKT